MFMTTNWLSDIMKNTINGAFATNEPQVKKLLT